MFMETFHPAYSWEHLLLTSYILVTSGVSGGFVWNRVLGFGRNRSVGIRIHDVWAGGVKSTTTHISGDKCDKVFGGFIIILTKMNEE
jgi:hypothetical protein